MPLLDPRYFRIDDILRRPFHFGNPLASGGKELTGDAVHDWGFPSAVVFRRNGKRQELAPFRLRIRADGQAVVPASGIDRPSHSTLNAVGGESGLQITEDKFVTGDNVAVSVLSLRNPGDMPISLRIEPTFGLPGGLQEVAGDGVWIYREGPPGDDLRIHLNAFSVRTLVFALGLGDTEDQSWRRVWRWRNHLDPVALQRHESQVWFDDNVPGFDCSDPWLNRMWYHRWLVAKRNGIDSEAPGTESLAAEIGDRTRPAISTASLRSARLRQEVFALWQRRCRAQFADGDFDRPYFPVEAADTADLSSFFRINGCLWAEQFLTDCLGIVPDGAEGLQILPFLPESALRYFCVENIPVSGKLLTLVWDDPTEAEDAYQDGDKGLSVYVNGRKTYHQDTLNEFEIELNPPPETDEEF